jgi:diguanylate cyclase (GGDEF)-like protein
MRRTDWKSGLLWTACFALTVLVMGWVTRQESDHRLEQDAEHSGLRWSKQLVRSVPELVPVFARGQATPAVLAQVAQLDSESDIFHWSLQDTQGRVVLNSDALRQPGAANAGEALQQQVDSETTAPAALRKQVLSGLSRTTLQRGSSAGLPDVYSEVWVPVIDQGRVLGLAYLVLDQSVPAASAAAGLVRIASTVTLLLLLIAALAAYQHYAGRKRQRSADAQVRYLAEHDPLTATLNRAGFLARLGATAGKVGRPGHAFTLLRVNLDRFASLNESLGRELGDEVLRVTAKRLRACLRAEDQLGRLEGDEFAVLLHGPGTRDAVDAVAKNIQRVLAEPMAIGGQEVRCAASTGIALYGVDSVDPAVLLNMTDLALFRAKSQGGRRYAFHDAGLDGQVQSRRELARDLRSALAGGQLVMFYQPLFATDGAELVGYEALLRWDHPERGMVSPGEFIPLAESAGLIDDIGLWALRQACTDASQWPAPLTVAVNLSANQFASGRLVRQVARTLADSGLAPERLGLEITESLLMTNSEQVMQTLRRLGALGVSIAMDDFGTGYSSLAYLWRFPFDKLKIDQVFTRNMVQDPKVAMIVRSIITLAHSLDMRVNAEGIEDPQQMAMLQSLGCDELQGFLLGKPGPHASLTHAGHIQGSPHTRPRGDDRESLFATLQMGLPPRLDPH